MTVGELAPDRESRLRTQISRWRDDLIDLSKRNRLLWFRATATSTFELRQPDLRTIHGRTMGGGSWGFYLPPDPTEPPHDPPRPAPLPRPDELVTDKRDPIVIRRGLQSLERRTGQTYLDTGLWVLYMGLGMLKWRGPDDSEDAHSPLILVPVTLERPSPREPFQLRRTEGDLVFNPALAVQLLTDFGVSLPALDDTEDSEIDAVFAGVRSACRQWPDWTIEERAVLATFSFHKEAMYRDLLENEDALVAHSGVRVLGLGHDEAGTLAFAALPEAQLDEALPPEGLVSILDADSTQRQCIKATLDGRSFVMDGPPGTGKSQTIANLIAELISRGQTVLFVSEKAAALDVVQSRLTAAGLGEFLLALHSHKATRKEVAMELGRALMTQPMPGTQVQESALSQLRHRRQALTAYVEAINERREPLGRSLHSAYGRIALLSSLPRVAWWTGSIRDLTIDRYSEILDSARGLSRAWGPVERGDDFLWRDLAFERSDMQLVHQIKGDLEACVKALDTLRESAVRVANETGLDWTGGPQRARDLGEVGRHLAKSPDIPSHWLSRPTPSVVSSRLGELEAAWDAVANCAHGLQQTAGPEYRRLEPADYTKLVDGLGAPAENTVKLASTASLAVTWRLPASASAADVGRVSRLADTLIREIPDVAAQASKLVAAFGGSTSQINLRQARVLAELGGMVSDANRPETVWLNPITLPSLHAAAHLLGTLVEQYRARRAELSEVFTDKVLALDLETLCPRFEQVYRGPFVFLRRQFWADRKLLASVTRLGRVDRKVRAHLRNALEWQRLSNQLTQAERQHAGVIGERYYQGEQTDLSALIDAVEHAQRAVQLAGTWIDLSAVARQLAVDGSPDIAVLEVSRDVGPQVDRLLAEIEEVIPDTLPALLDGQLADVQRSSEQAVAPLKMIQSVLAAVAEVADHEVTLNEAWNWLEARSRLARLERELQESTLQDVNLLGAGYRGAGSDCSALRAALEWSVALIGLTGEVSDRTASQLLSAKFDPELLPSQVQEWGRCGQAVLARFKPDQADRLRQVLIATFDGSAALLETLSRTTGDIDEWLRHVHLRDELGIAGLGSAVADCARLEVPPRQVVDLVERAVLEGWSDKIAQEGRQLGEFRSQDRDRLVEEFRELDRDLIRKSAARVIEQCNERRPDSMVGQAGIIQAQASLRRRHRPIRRLLTDAGDVALRLKPCFMMSPLSVSSFLPPNMRFDVVIFDEASQVRPCDAINCIYRGNRLIVAGDDKQLPPSSFFDAQIADVAETDDDAAAIQDFDSILKQCQGSGFPSLSLQWHYRSQHESLIAFSNASFYDGALLTFPGALAQAPDLGVEFFRVNGTYRVRPHNDNPIEAAKVAERVLYYADLNTRREQPLSVGVVTFSDAQEECVWRAIDDLRAHRPDLEGFYRADRLNGFFVKNLESVQGDERDVMIFSVGYAYDSTGRFALRMGPLTSEGGHRRLNVAITRARRRVEVIASVGAEDFKGEIREGGGVWHLREYLAYVARGGVFQSTPVSTAYSFGSDMEESVARTLESWGYVVVPQVGMARYRVDLGVRRRDDPSRFLIGVECDGAMYHSSRVARDRDRLRHKVLTGLGWKLHRVWSPAWYRDRPGEEQRLRVALEAAEAAPLDIPVRREQEADETQPAEIRVVELEAEQPAWSIPYQIARPMRPQRPVEMHTLEAGADIRRMVLEVAEIESPVHSELVLRRVREAWGAGRAGSRIRPNFDAALERLRREGRVRIVGDFIWQPNGGAEHVRVPDPTRPETERRVEHVPPQELDSALAQVASGAVAASENQLTEKVAEVFGWRRRGPDISAALTGSVQRLVGAGKLEQRGDALYWLGEPPPNRQGRRVTEQVVEPPERPVPRQVPTFVPSERPTILPVAPSEPPVAITPSPTNPAKVPSDIDRCLTPGGHQRLLDEVELSDERLQSARQQGDPLALQRATAENDRLNRLLEETRVLPAPTDRAFIVIGSLVGFREADGPEETWQLVPPLEADAEQSRMSVLTPMGQALLGKAAGDVVEVEAPSGSYLVEVTAIELP